MATPPGRPILQSLTTSVQPHGLKTVQQSTSPLPTICILHHDAGVLVDKPWTRVRWQNMLRDWPSQRLAQWVLGHCIASQRRRLPLGRCRGEAVGVRTSNPLSKAMDRPSQCSSEE